MKGRAILLGVLLANCVFALAHAEVISRVKIQMAAGVCQPFVPTSAVRYNASGITNAGTTAIFVVCSLDGSPTVIASGNQLAGASLFRLAISNNSGSTQTTNCTARPGQVAGNINDQLSLPLSSVLTASVTHDFMWSAGDGTLFANANFTCVLNPGHTLHRIKVDYLEDVGGAQ